MDEKRPIKKGYIYAKLNRIYLLSMLIPILFLASVFSFYFYRLIQKDEIEMGKSVLSAIELNISTCFDRMNQCSLGWVGNTHIFDFYKKTNANNGEIPAQPLNLTNHYITASNTLLSLSGKDVLGIGFYPVKNAGRNYYYFKRYTEDFLVTENYPIEQTAWYALACKNVGTAVYAPPTVPSYENDEADPVFSIVRMVRDLDSRKSVGIVKVDVSLSYLDSLFRSASAAKRSGYMILDNEKNVIYSTNDETLELASYWEPDTASFYARGKGRYYTHSIPIGKSPWTLVYLVSSKDIFSRTNFIFYITALVGALALFIALSLFKLNSDRLTVPVNNILKVMQKNETGKLTEKIEVDPHINDEFSLISRQYNHMIDMLNVHIDREYKAQLEQQRAEFFALQMQINPHFLYNMLNGFMALNRLGESRLLERAIIQLTELFRYTCSNEHIVKIYEEIQFVERYLFLQKLRFSDRLAYTIVCPEAVREIFIPKLIIQPLVENAIIHGLEPIDRLVHVTVSVTLNERFVCITVEDDGRGVDMEKLDCGMHVGLDNVRRRIQALLPGGKFYFSGALGTGAISKIEFSL